MFLFGVLSLRVFGFQYFLSYIIIKTRCTCSTIFSPVQFKTRRRPASHVPARVRGTAPPRASAELSLRLNLRLHADYAVRQGEPLLNSDVSSLHPGPHNAALPVDVRHRSREPPRRTHGPRICGGAIRKSRACHAVLRAARRVFVATQGPDAPRTLNRAQHDTTAARAREVDTLAHRLLTGPPANLERLATFEDQTEPEC